MDKDLQVVFARNLTEPLVGLWFINQGYEIEQSTMYEDYSGIDLKVKDKETGTIIKCDVKCPSLQNIKSNNFLYTTISNNGKNYNNKETDYVIFINVNAQEFVFVPWDRLPELLKCGTEHQSKYSVMGKYVLLDKNMVKLKDYVKVRSYKL